MQNTVLKTINVIFLCSIVIALSAMQKAPEAQVMTVITDTVKKTTQCMDDYCCDLPAEKWAQCIRYVQKQRRIHDTTSSCSHEKEVLCCCAVATGCSCYECPTASCCCCIIGLSGGYFCYRGLKKERWHEIRGDKYE